jgi:hypothetical protein
MLNEKFKHDLWIFEQANQNRSTTAASSNLQQPLKTNHAATTAAATKPLSPFSKFLCSYVAASIAQTGTTTTTATPPSHTTYLAI